MVNKCCLIYDVNRISPPARDLGNSSIQAMLFHNNKVELSLIWEKFLARFKKFKNKNANELESLKPDLCVPVLLVEFSIRDSYKESSTSRHVVFPPPRVSH